MPQFATGSRHVSVLIPETIYGVTPSAPTGADIPVTGNTITMTTEPFTSQILRSDRQITSQRNGFFRSAGDLPSELLFGDHDDLYESAFFGEWAGDVLKAGVTEKSFTVERQHLDIGRHRHFTGCIVNQVNVSIQVNSPVVGVTFRMVGQERTNTAIPLVASPTPQSGNDPMDTFSATIQEGGVDVAVLTGIDFTLDNGLEGARVLGSKSDADQMAGTSNLTGTVSARLLDDTFLDKFINEVESSLRFTGFDPAGNSLDFYLPRIKYTGGDDPVQGPGGIITNLPFQALRDPTEQSNIVLTRTAA